MLHELRVENLLLMQRAELRLGPGLNVLTGETGAGKTLLAHALDLLLGGRARRGIVRPGADEAYVEGVFALPDALAGSERLPSGAEEIVLARRVWPDGRTRAYVCGRAATQADLRELGERLISFYGQHEHRKLMLSAAQLDLLDASGGPTQLALRARVREAHEDVRELGRRAEALRELAGARDRELDLLRFELDEIEAADPREGEVAELTAERDRLRHQEELARAASGAAEALAPEGGSGAVELVSGAGAQLSAVGGLDSRLRELADRLQALQYEAQDVVAELRAHLASLGDPDAPAGDGAARLQEVEERLALLARLERKHGGSIADVLAHAEACAARRDELAGADDALAETEGTLAEAQRERDELAGELGTRRRRGAPRLAAAVRERLGELAMAQAHFSIELAPRPDGCGPRGAETIEMLVASNGAGARASLREVASGGELSRVMLALLSVAHGGTGGADARDALLVFDEIDAGIGGHTARAVGRHLRGLAGGDGERARQVLCITHLPQVASLADRHFTIAKDVSVTPATTTVTALEGDAIVGELVRMLGAGEDDAAAGEHARELLRAA
ncbi:MAG: DNA repair protein RecN [Solirubrobacterales bacterium]|nr:DNA repair protein RecN [Solirubrobacterales bacterium]